MTAAKELRAKCADFLAGRYGRLTTKEIEEFRAAQSDPDGMRWEREHAGDAVGVEALELNGFLLVEFPASETLEESMDRLRRIAGGRPLTPARLWWIAKRGLARKEDCHE